VSKAKIPLILFAAAAVALSAMNASWIAPKPKGALALIAHRGIGQPIDRAAPAAATCSARFIRASGHNFIENSQFSMQSAIGFGAQGLLLDVRSSADGHAVIFRDAGLECRTNGSGRVGDRSLAYLKSLDIGFGYSADHGRTFPFRGRGVGGMLTVEDVLRAFPRAQLIFDLADARAAEAAVAAFGRAGVPIGAAHGFAGGAEALARLRQLTPGGWTLDREASRACVSAYRRTGWLGLVPETCRGVALDLPYGGAWTLWGWPYRFLDRMAGAGARPLLTLEPDGPALVGLDQPEQLGEVPYHYAGLLLVEDIYEVGRALVR
jgi:glycerophosphoryl diester phosphodiesterase